MNRRGVFYLFVAAGLVLVVFAGVDFWIFRFWTGPNALYNYWIAVALTFFAIGICMSTAMWTANSEIKPKIVLGVALTPFLLFVAGIWDWILYVIYIYNDVPYPDYKIWAAQDRWFGFWNIELQTMWTLGFLVLIGLLWWRLAK